MSEGTYSMAESNGTDNGGGANTALLEIGAQTSRDVGANRQDLSAELERIQRNEDLSESAKSRLSEEARSKASARHAEIISEHEKATRDVLEANERKLFKLSYPEGTLTPSQKQEFRASYRDASFRILDMPEDTLSRILTRAQRVGDTALETAVYHESIERGLFAIAEEYRSKHPDARDVWETYEKTRLSEEAHGASLTRALLSTANPGT
jgi:hypothetical protein